MAIGLPDINLIFKGLAASAIQRSERGIVACILKDDTEGGQRLATYESIIDIDFENWSETNYGFLKLVFEGGPVRVIALREKTASANLSAALKELMYCLPIISAGTAGIMRRPAPACPALICRKKGVLSAAAAYGRRDSACPWRAFGGVMGSKISPSITM